MDGIVCDKHGVQRQRPCPSCEIEKRDTQIWQLQDKIKELEADAEAHNVSRLILVEGGKAYETENKRLLAILHAHDLCEGCTEYSHGL